MATYQDDGRWRYRFRYRGKRYGGSAAAENNTKRGASKREREHLDKLERRQFTGVMPTVDSFAVRFLEHQSTRTGQGTRRAQASHLNVNILPHLGRLLLDEVDKANVDRMVSAWRSANAEATTCNNRLTTLATLMALAVEWGFLEKVPAIRKLRVASGTPRFLSELEAQQLLDAAPAKWRTMMLVGLRTGLRVGELRGLRWRDIDFGASTIRVRRTHPGRAGAEPGPPKGRRERTVPLTNEASEALRALLNEHGGASSEGPVFPGFTSRSKYDFARVRSEDACVKAITAASKAAHLHRDASPIGWHTLRHTYASWLVARGVHMAIVAKLLGHANTRMTEIYAHLAPDLSLHDVVASLDFNAIGSGQQVTKALPSKYTNADDEVPPNGVAPSVHTDRRERVPTTRRATVSRRQRVSKRRR